jgi:hypothetical protein
MKFSWKGYWEPTPQGIRKIADSILAGAMTVSTISFASDYHTVAIIVLIAAGITKMVSNFFTSDEELAAKAKDDDGGDCDDNDGKNLSEYDRYTRHKHR